MAVYARGYRRYEGEFKLRSPVFPIFREGFRIIRRTWSFKILGLLTLLVYVIHTIVIYLQLNVTEFMDTQLRGEGLSAEEFARHTQKFVAGALGTFYGMAILFATLLTMFAGAGLIADDLRTRALPLYIVRPIRPLEYVFGKALLIPGFLAVLLLLPGVSFYLMAGMWQQDGMALTFLGENIDMLGAVFQTWLIASLTFTGIMLVLSSRTERRGSVTAVSAAVFFVGTVVASIGGHMSGGIGQLLKYVSAVSNSISPLLWYAPRAFNDGHSIDRTRMAELHPHPEMSLVIGLAVFALGCFAVYRRARTTEVSG